ncbi:Ribosomal-protein-alanine acetyltransferase [Andreprevotia sp. IGB-42]|uniref:GNAT family N-acetyltransferase n=1 Tax=Andreprevotia sp. IGB-42 TaxID=2497473 RepID=UPI00135947DB|nr:GNAT family N-acetyltransferase [Andreprevotia sp. IGB-42]KAF0813807.1 Ribosomal-protein-alanine acetyltransferase [Andreprevotia sp. IGB-42]
MAVATAHIPHLETLTLSAWPALSTEWLDGWVLRFASGYTKRANSVSPLHVGVLPDEAKLAYVEARYHAQGQPAVFKLTAAVSALDALLVQRGYEEIDRSSVQTLALSPAHAVADVAVTLWQVPDGAWFAAFAALSNLDAAQQHTARQMLAAYACPVAFGAVLEQGRIVACGFAVRQWDSVLLFDIVTDPALRRRGHARRLVASLLAWGYETGAAQAVLQVVAANAPAVALYAGLGFAEQYQYWYRRQPR